MAEYLLKSSSQLDQSNMTIISAGLGAMVGHSADPTVRTLLAEQGIDCRQHIAQQVSEQLVDDMDLILVMEQHHRQDMLNRFPNARSKLFLLRHHDQQDVADPYKQGLSAFEQAKNDITIGIDQWVNTLKSL
jgi:protein-tyrosine phosphatase